MKRFPITIFLVLFGLLLSTNCCRQASKSAESSYEESYEEGIKWNEGYRDGGEEYLILEDEGQGAGPPDIHLDEDGDGIPDNIDLNPDRADIPREEVDAIVEDLNSRDLEEELVPMSGEEPREEGTLVYKVDSVLIIGVVSRVEARIINQTEEGTVDRLVELTTHTSTGVIYSQTVRVGDIMSMNLKTTSPDAITITEITDSEQPVDETDVTFWLWSVTANKVGSYDLILTAKITDRGPARDLIIFDEIVNVKNKPKKKFSISLDFPETLKRHEESILKLEVSEVRGDAYDFEWGGEGKIVLEFDGKVQQITDENIINDRKPEFNYTWIVTPEGKQKLLPYTLKIIGDYEDAQILEHNFIVEKNPKESFNRFVDEALKRWYWLFTALLIPLYGFLRKKFFKKDK